MPASSPNDPRTRATRLRVHAYWRPCGETTSISAPPDTSSFNPRRPSRRRSPSHTAHQENGTTPIRPVIEHSISSGP